ncbi:MAG: UDP-N-acetylglucosamine 2-epimerase (hydrolyzing) [Chloroflexi bacterium]|nr:UDP-N-acetylglucosamine 2-epimerase (hydrolyzing) [Chloroflexota bacterium]
MRTIGIVSVGRSDYGIYTPLLRKIQADEDLNLHLIVAGMHLSPEFGYTVQYIEADGFEIGEKVEMLVSSNTPQGVAKSLGLGIIGFSQALEHVRPDILIVLGDRFEMYSAALAALPYKIPVAHIHGGEVTHGAIDDALRHSITKLSHLHFVSTDIYKVRVEQLGEEPWRIAISGAPALGHLRTMELLSKEKLESCFEIPLDIPPLLVTFHPVTLEFEKTEWQVDELLAALDMISFPIVFTMPNADTGHNLIHQKIKEFANGHSSTWLFDNLGTQNYFSLMKYAAAMVGNSSSGIIEAPSFELPVVNIGTRQSGRMRAANVIDTGYMRDEILGAIQKAVSFEFRQTLEGLQNPYGDGFAAEKIVQKLKTVVLDDKLLTKRFWDVEFTPYCEEIK